MKHGWTVFACIIVLMIAQSSVLFCCAEDDLTVTETFFAAQEAPSGWIDVPGKGMMRYYAQNDSLWQELTYERKSSSKSRPFGDGGCCPTALAMTVRQLVEANDLNQINAHAKTPYALCACSINQGKCGYDHARYILTSARDFDRFLPLIFADYACGNNNQGAHGRSEEMGTSSGFAYHIARAYGLEVTATSSYDEAVQALKDGKAVMAHAARDAAFTSTGHYVNLAHADDECLYVLDPLCRETYKTAHGSKLHVIQPGLVSIEHENIRFTGLSSFMIFSKHE